MFVLMYSLLLLLICFQSLILFHYFIIVVGRGSRCGNKLHSACEYIYLCFI